MGVVEQAADALLGTRSWYDAATRQDVIEVALLGALGLPSFVARLQALQERVEEEIR